MRIAILSVEARESGSPLIALTERLAEGMRSVGHQVDIHRAHDDVGSRLPGYDYIAVCAETLSPFSAKLSPRLQKTLAGASSLVGKRSAAFLRKKGLFTSKALAAVMQAMEKEGMTVNWSDFLLSPDHAQALGKGIGA